MRSICTESKKKSSPTVVQLAFWLRQSKSALATKLGPESYREYAPDAAALERKYGIDQIHCTKLSFIIYRPRILKSSLVKTYFIIRLQKCEKDKTLSNLALNWISFTISCFKTRIITWTIFSILVVYLDSTLHCTGSRAKKQNRR